MTSFAMQLAPEIEPRTEESPLAAARLHRQLTLEEAARRAGISTDEARWLEDGRVYRFPSADDALLATVLYSTGLGLEHREALELAGRPVPPRALQVNPWGRVAVLATIVVTLLALLLAVALPSGAHDRQKAAARPTLPPPWAFTIDVLNGSGDINFTRQVASRIGALGYRVHHVGRADRFDYRETAVYYEPGGEKFGERLARQLCAPLEPLPGGANPHRLVVIAGPPTVSAC